ncbi:PREDICTED: uncharacterized protein LOC108510420 [Lepidothrix coronata]|uniref:Uncharacterized protein LOC108510420 n=1 Tax=Lepidothrix coronata TaxID=321398 RepID=A0A6J0J9F6_9PASS|nr:PREDICTED: uncharacterized protein LOC108510420 [Lepidothrix coronata]
MASNNGDKKALKSLITWTLFLNILQLKNQEEKRESQFEIMENKNPSPCNAFPDDSQSKNQNGVIFSPSRKGGLFTDTQDGELDTSSQNSVKITTACNPSQNVTPANSQDGILTTQTSPNTMATPVPSNTLTTPIFGNPPVTSSSGVTDINISQGGNAHGTSSLLKINTHQDSSVHENHITTLTPMIKTNKQLAESSLAIINSSHQFFKKSVKHHEDKQTIIESENTSTNVLEDKMFYISNVCSLVESSEFYNQEIATIFKSEFKTYALGKNESDTKEKNQGIVKTTYNTQGIQDSNLQPKETITSIDKVKQAQLIEVLKKEVRAILITAKEGLTPAELEDQYITMIHKPLPLKDLGFQSTLELVTHMPEVVQVYSHKNGTVILKAIVDDTAKDIAKPVACQKGRTCKRTPPNVNATSPSKSFKNPQRSPYATSQRPKTQKTEQIVIITSTVPDNQGLLYVEEMAYHDDYGNLYQRIKQKHL